MSLAEVQYCGHYKGVDIRDGTGATARRTDGVGKIVEGVGARFTDGSRVRTSKTVRVETMGYGIFKVTLCTKENVKSVKQVHWGTASRARMGIVLDEVATTGTANLMGHVIRGVKSDEGIDVSQANETLLKAEMDGITD